MLFGSKFGNLSLYSVGLKGHESWRPVSAGRDAVGIKEMLGSDLRIIRSREFGLDRHWLLMADLEQREKRRSLVKVWSSLN